MRRIVTGIVTAMLLAFSAVAASAMEVEGKIQSVDPTERTITLDDGTKIWVSDTMASGGELKEGAEVKISYEEKDGKNVATSVEKK